MSLEALADVAAERAINVDAAAADAREAVATEAARLWNAPDDRNIDILLDIVEAEEMRMSAETSDPKLALRYWDHITAYALDVTIDEMFAVPVGERGIMWEAIVTTIMAACYRQAFITHGPAREMILIALEGGQQLVDATRGMSPEQIAAAQYPVQQRIADAKAKTA